MMTCCDNKKQVALQDLTMGVMVVLKIQFMMCWETTTPKIKVRKKS